MRASISSCKEACAAWTLERELASCCCSERTRASASLARRWAAWALSALRAAASRPARCAALCGLLGVLCADAEPFLAASRSCRAHHNNQQSGVQHLSGRR